MIDRILEAVRPTWPDLEIGYPMPDHMTWALQSRRRIIYFLFAPNQRDYPALVVKLCRNTAENHELEQYLKRAQAARALLDADTGRTVPTMCLLEPINGLSAVAEKGLAGQPIDLTGWNRNQSSLVEASCSSFADWLLHFQRCTRSGQIQITRETLGELSGLLEKEYHVDESLRRKAEGIFAPLEGTVMPLVWTYGDAHPSNILLDGRGVSGVVDWEGCRPDQLPIFDWFQYSVCLAQELLKSHTAADTPVARVTEACLTLVQEPRTRIAAVLQDQTRVFLSGLGLGPQVLPLFLVFLVKYFTLDSNTHSPQDKQVLVRQVLAEV